MENQSIDLRETPYRGLIPYSEEDAPFFFGRTKDTKSITDSLTGSPLTLLYGSSGVGKSSVLQAGVAYHLRQEAKQNLEDYGTPEFAVVVFNSWRDAPLDELVNSVQESVAQAIEGNLNELTKLVQERVQDHLKLTETLPAWAALLSGEDIPGKLFVILDQFEEYFLYHPDEEGERTFFTEFPSVVNHPDINFLISIREDSLAQLDRFKPSIPSLFDNYLRLKHLDRHAAGDAIVKPVKEAYNKLVSSEEEESFDVEPALAEAVLNQISQYVPSENGLGGIDKVKALQEKQVEVAYLQIVMTVLWGEEKKLWDEEKKPGLHKLRLETLNKLGGTDKIVDKYLNNKMKFLPRDQRYAAAIVFQQLVTPFGTKISYPALELAKHTQLSQNQLENLLKKLDEQRIIRSTRASTDDPTAKRYEIFHDKLVKPILKWRQQYLEEQNLEEKQQQLKLINNSTIKQGLAAQSLRQTKLGQDEKAALLARQAYRFYQRDNLQLLYQVDDALRVALSVDNFSSILQFDNEILSVAFSPDNKTMAFSSRDGNIKLLTLGDHLEHKVLKGHDGKGHVDSVNSVAFSPDGRMLASGSDDQTIRIWNPLYPDYPPKVLNGHKGRVNSVAFSPDGQTLASGSDDGTIKLWDYIDLPHPYPKTLKSHQGSVRAIAFSPEGKKLASGSDDKTVRLWNLKNLNAAPILLHSHEKSVRAVTFSPNGHILASASDDRTVWLHNMHQPSYGQVITTLKHRDSVKSVTFSSDSQMLVSAGDDQTIRFWDLSQPDKVLKILKGHYFDVNSVAFSPNNEMLLSGSRDNTARLWDLRQPTATPKILKDHTENVMSIAFSLDGQILASGSWDKTVRLWWNLDKPNASLRVLRDHQDKVMSVVFSSDGKTLASGSGDKTVRLWNLQQPNLPPKVLSGHQDGVSAVAFSPNDPILASGSWKNDKTIRLWDLNQLDKAPIVLRGHEDSITSLAFSPDGKMLASGSDDKTIRLWKLEQPDAEPKILKGHEGRVWSVAFSPPDGKMLASGSDDWSVRLWDLQNLDAKPIVLKEHNSWVGSVAFSPDGKTLASGGYDRTIRLWDLDQLDWTRHQIKTAPIVLEGHDQSVTSVAFSSDNKTLASGSFDNTIRLWNTSTKELADMVCAKVQRNLSQKEWNWFMGDDIPYERTCPNLPLGEGISEEIARAEEESELEREFRVKLANFFPGQRYVLEFIEQRSDQQLDISEEDVTNLMHKPKGDAGTFYRLETLRLLGFLEITDRGHGYGTIRYGLSPRYREYLSKTKARPTE